MDEGNLKDEKQAKDGWGVENYPYPEGVAYISARWDICIGCGACEMACSMAHYGIINRELSRIRIFRYLLPLPKSVQNICVQCREEERECQKACPLDPPVIYYDSDKQHMVVDSDRCLGQKCGQCRKACPADVPRFYPESHDHALVCDLCGQNGKRRPECVDICPTQALVFISPKFPQHLERVHPDRKADMLSRRLFPLSRDRLIRPPQDIWGEDGHA
jgi:carbon-monoxide dehydrogenase iron sulfur subunit